MPIEIDLLWLFGFVPAVLAGYLIFRYRLHKVRVAFDELAQAIGVLDDALADDKVSEDEFRNVYAQFKEAVAAFVDIVK